MADPRSPGRSRRSPTGSLRGWTPTAIARTLIAVGLWSALAVGPAAAYLETPVPDGGTLSGRVRFIGSPVKAEPIPVRKNIEVCGDAKPSEALVVGPTHGVKYTVVYLEGVERGKKAVDLEVDNVTCAFVPHVSAVTLGARVRLKNGDAILHNSHGVQDKVTVFNIAQPLRGQVVDVTQRIKKTGVIDVQCDAHTHMRGWIVVRDNPYFAVTDDEGRFRIVDIPPGRYRLVAWHEGWAVTGRDKDGRPVYEAPRVLSREVTIPAGGETTVEFELK